MPALGFAISEDDVLSERDRDDKAEVGAASVTAKGLSPPAGAGSSNENGEPDDADVGMVMFGTTGAGASTPERFFGDVVA